MVLLFALTNYLGDDKDGPGDDFKVIVRQDTHQPVVATRNAD